MVRMKKRETHAKACRGRVVGGVVVLEDPKTLPEGTEVVVKVVDGKGKHRTERSGWDELLKLAGMLKGLPPDFARNHDHYVHGRPKK